MCFSLFAIGLVVATLYANAMNPLILTPGHDPCFPIDTPPETICYPLRCFHLFNVSIAGISPTPQSGYPQHYVAFNCSVESYEQYTGYAARLCLKPMCTCLAGYNARNDPPCCPLKLGDCWNQTCVAG
jgi:hypothetical protein